MINNIRVAAISLALSSLVAIAHPGDGTMRCTPEQNFICETNAQKIREGIYPSCLDWMTKPSGGAFTIQRTKKEPLTYEIPIWFKEKKDLMEFQSTDSSELNHLSDRHFVSKANLPRPGFDQETGIWAMIPLQGIHIHNPCACDGRH